MGKEELVISGDKATVFGSKLKVILWNTETKGKTLMSPFDLICHTCF
jgi:hypothetical protein